jgi:peptidoglycan/LPS O-acetylase OafA/YrhL
MPRLLAARPLAFVGTVSFSLYLVHWPIVLMLKDYSLIIRLLVSFAAGVALHFAVERPARRALAARPTRQVVLSWLGAAAVATVLAGVMNTAIG